VAVVHIYTQTIHRTTQTNSTYNNTIGTKQYIEQHNSLIRKSVDRVPSFRDIPWHLPYNWGKSMEKPQSG